MRTRTPLPSLLILAFLLVGTAQAEIRYVKSGGSGDGTSWSKATGNLQTMLDAAVAGDEIWVAAGTYKPSATRLPGGFTFAGSSIALYGGFPADATDSNSFTDRNPHANPTILSGDINGDDTVDVITGLPDPASMADNASHVLDFAGLDAGEIRVEGFTITGGNAGNDPGYGGAAQSGGGIRVIGSTGYRAAGLFILHSCEIRRNRAGTGDYSGADGGGVFVQSSDLVVENCTIDQNAAGQGMDGGNGIDGEMGISGTPGGNGGGVAVWYSNSAIFDHVYFKANVAGRGGNGGHGGASLTTDGGRGGDGGQGGRGGALSLDWVSTGVQIRNCGFFGNQAGKAGDGGNGGNYTAVDKLPGSGGNGATSNAANGIASGCGGAVAMSSCSQGTVENSTFADNASGEGGTGGAPGSFTGTGGASAQPGTSGEGGEGGAIFLSQGAINLLNCTFAKNKAAGNGGAVCFSPGYTGYSGTLTGTHLTFADNTTDSSGGALTMASTDILQDAVWITNSVFWGNLVSGSAPGGVNSDVWADAVGMTITNSVLVQGPPAVNVLNCVDTDPLLKALSWNGGPTPTVAPQPGSVIIDATFLEASRAINVDQRGFPRDAAPDAGAFEVRQQARGIAVSNLERTTATLSWTPGVWGYSVVFIRPDDPADPKPRPADGWYYNPDPAFGTGGYITETPWSCVFAGMGNTVAVTGLTSNTKYSVMVCDTERTTYLHNTEDALDNPLVFETLALAPPTLVFPVNCPDKGVTGPPEDDPAYGHSLASLPVFVWDPPANATGYHFQVFLDANDMIGNTAINPIGFRCFDGESWTAFPVGGMPAGTVRLAFERAGGGEIVPQRSLQVLEHMWWVVASDTVRASTESTHFRFLSQIPAWEDGTAVAGYTLIRKAQIEQLRDETNALRRLYGLADAAFTDPTLVANETPVRADHFTQLRAAITEAADRTGENTAAWAWTDAVLTPNTTAVKAVHLEELRRALEGAYPLPAVR